MPSEQARFAIAIQKAVRTGVPSANRIRQWAAAAAGAQARGELTVRIVGEDESAALNAAYRHRQGATNVLSFPADSGELASLVRQSAAEAAAGDGELLPFGDLVVCAPVVTREAQEQGKQPEAHWAHIVMHGTLHLLGYDHESDGDARAMEDRERELLAGFGFGDPYSLDSQ
jgi:probable rRNA maturation factor